MRWQRFYIGRLEYPGRVLRLTRIREKTLLPDVHQSLTTRSFLFLDAVDAPDYSAAMTALQRYHLGFLAARIGEWNYLVALNWSVLVQTQSALMLGLINACRLLPALFMCLVSGSLSDRYDSRRLLVFYYWVVSFSTLMVGALVVNQAPLAWVALFVFLRELANTAEPTGRNLLVTELLPRQPARALAANATVLNAGRVVGPLIAGGLLARGGFAPAFLLGSLGLALCAMVTARLPLEPTLRPNIDGGHGGYGEALRFIRANRRLKLLILLMIAPMLLAFPYISMLPLYTDKLLGLGAQALGVLLSMSAIGSLVASATIYGNSERVLRGTFQVGSLLLFSASLTVAVVAPNLAIASLAVLVAGASSQAYRTTSRILAQSGVPRALHGRIVSIILMDRGLIPLGALILGAWANWFGPLASALLMGVGSGLATLALLALCPDILKLGPVGALEPAVEARTILPPGPI